MRPPPVIALVLPLAAGLSLGCATQPWERGPVLVSAEPPAGDRGVLGEAVATRLGTARAPGAAEVVRAFRWRPAEDAQLWVWVACRGAGNERACAVAAARAPAPGGPLRVLGIQAVGWAVPQIGATADRTELVISGDDGRGTWRQQARYYADSGGSVWFGRRLYADGM